MNAGRLHLCRRQRRADDFTPAGECHLAARNFADFGGQPVVDLITDYQEPEQGAVGSGAAVDRLDKSLVEVMFAQPPVAGFSVIFIERLLEILFCGFAREARSLGVQGDDLAATVHHHKQVAARNLRNVLRRVLDGDRVRTRHDGARDGKVGQKSHVAGQHGFAFVAEILKRGDGIFQVDGNALADVAFHAAPHQEQAGRSEAGGDEQHRKQKSSTQAQARHKGRGRLGLVGFRHGFRGSVRASQRTNLYPIPCTVRKCTGLAGSLSSFCRSLRMWLSTVRVEG